MFFSKSLRVNSSSILKISLRLSHLSVSALCFQYSRTLFRCVRASGSAMALIHSSSFLEIAASMAKGWWARSACSMHCPGSSSLSKRGACEAHPHLISCRHCVDPRAVPRTGAPIDRFTDSAFPSVGLHVTKMYEGIGSAR